MTKNFSSPQDLLGAVGADLGVTDWVTITQDQIDKFAEATLDNQWIHVDTERAKAGPFGTPIADAPRSVVRLDCRGQRRRKPGNFWCCWKRGRFRRQYGRLTSGDTQRLRNRHR